MCLESLRQVGPLSWPFGNCRPDNLVNRWLGMKAVAQSLRLKPVYGAEHEPGVRLVGPIATEHVYGRTDVFAEASRDL